MSPIVRAPDVGAQNDTAEAMSWPLVVLTLFATLGGFLFGYDTGVVSGVALFWADDSSLDLSDSQIQQIVSVTVGAATVGTAMSGMPLQWYGRRPLIVAAGAFYVAGSVALALAPSYLWLLIGRLALGLGVGLSSIAVPVYLAEASPPLFRGRVVSCYTVSIVAGQAAACVVNIVADACLSEQGKWRVSLGFAALPALLLLAGFACFGLPESPKWLASRGRAKEAQNVLAKLRGASGGGIGSDGHSSSSSSSSRSGGSSSRNGSSSGSGSVLADQVESDWQALLVLPSDDVGDVKALVREVWHTPALRRAFRLGIGLQALQQLSGINTIMYYGAPILVMCGFPASQSVQLSLLLACAQGIGLLASAPKFDTWGRRALLLPSALGAGFGLLAVAVAFATGVDAHRGAALVGLVVYLVSFGAGLAGGPWVVNSEVYPLHVRGLGQSAATTANWGMNYAVSATFLSAVNAFGRPAVFAGFAVVCWLGALWLYVALPETANKSLEEIADLFRRPGDDDVYTPAGSTHGGGGGKSDNNGHGALSRSADHSGEDALSPMGALDREGAEPLISDLARSSSSSSPLHAHPASSSNPRVFF